MKKNYQLGDIRTVVRFAWLPVNIGGTWIWFAKYICVQKYRRIHIPGKRYAPGWTTPDSQADVWSTIEVKQLI
jgi:hypothetical protein